MSFRAVVLSKSKSAKGAPSVTEPDLPQVPSLLSMSLIGLRLSPYHAASAARIRQPVPCPPAAGVVAAATTGEHQDGQSG
jgi:hypothetical protein